MSLTLSTSQAIPSKKRKRSQSWRTTPQKKGRTIQVSKREPSLYRTITDFKVTDFYSGVVACSDASSVASVLQNLTRGDTYLDNFIGGRIKPVGWEVRFSLIGADATNLVRIMLIQWMDSTTPTGSGLLQFDNAVQAPISPKLLTNRDNIIVLADQLFSTTVNGPNSCSGRIYVKSKNLNNVEFPSGATTPQKGNLVVLVVSDSSAVAHPTIAYYSRVTFTDQ